MVWFLGITPSFVWNIIFFLCRQIICLNTDTLFCFQGPWSLDVLHARRHACGAVIKVCKESGQLLVVKFCS